MNDLQVRYARIADFALETPASWLSPQEFQIWRNFRATSRRTSWLAGRILLKQLLFELFPSADQRTVSEFAVAMHVDSRPAAVGMGRPPQAFQMGHVLNASITLAHTERGVLAAVRPGVDAKIGADLVMVSAAQSLDWAMTPSERSWRRSTRCREAAAARIWAIKEAVFKAIPRTEGFSPSAIDAASILSPGSHREGYTRSSMQTQTWVVDGQIAAVAVAHSDRHDLATCDDLRAA